jgi:hypothetical protein
MATRVGHAQVLRGARAGPPADGQRQRRSAAPHCAASSQPSSTRKAPRPTACPRCPAPWATARCRSPGRSSAPGGPAMKRAVARRGASGRALNEGGIGHGGHAKWSKPRAGIDCSRPCSSTTTSPGVGADAADARDGHAGACAGGLHLGAATGRAEQQFVVVAAAQQAFVLQRARLRGQHRAARQRRQLDARADARALQDVAQVAQQPVADVDRAAARPRSARPSATRGSGHSIARRTRLEGVAGQADRAAEDLQRQPRVAQRAADPQVVARPRAAAQQRLADRDLAHHGDAQVQRARRWCRRRPARCRGGRPARTGPRASGATKASSARGSASASVKASGSAPQAARSLRLTASALWPRRSGATVDRKCRPSTSMSLDTASCCPAATRSSAQSSPGPSAARGTGAHEVALDELELAHHGLRSLLASSTADLTFIFSNTRARCTSTVRTLIDSSSAISLFGRPGDHQVHHLAFALGQLGQRARRRCRARAVPAAPGR